MTITLRCRRIRQHWSHIFRTEGRTFIRKEQIKKYKSNPHSGLSCVTPQTTTNVVIYTAVMYYEEGEFFDDK